MRSAAPAPVVVPPFWELARLLADPTQAKALDLLLDRSRTPVSYLASYCGVSAQTMTGHLSVLREAGWVSVRRSGRYRYVELAESVRADIAVVIEHLGALCAPPAVTSLSSHRELAALSRARTCYDHLAGRLGVDLLGVLVERGGIDRDDVDPDDPDRVTGADCPLHLGDEVEAVLEDMFGVRLELPPGRGRGIGACMDWSQREIHCSGRFGRRLLAVCVDLALVRRRPAGRSLEITPLGVERFSALGIDCA
ncbi:ArsR/SmtB family transcription factor [Brevibacterium casei]|uniref:Winged helix-turn-helix transcriptional regulator n=1 Tax=Brevibacterium casei TaxID=33889 RepID=A0A7T2TE77_9MICO|nr:winged helix-turn-helix domain-containing protein [Brevibacterium casei]QPS32211.1 winged helix-turn-helix transcriptional regulator [Brevibacterium casei]